MIGLSKVILAALLAVLPMTVCSQSELDRPFNSEDLGPAASARPYLETSHAVDRFEGWRTLVLAELAKGELADPAVLFALASEGAYYNVYERDLADEVMAAMSDTKLAAAFLLGLDEPAGSSEYQSKGLLAIAEEILSRQGLEDHHSQASLTRADMLFLTERDLSVVVDAYLESEHPSATPSARVIQKNLTTANDLGEADRLIQLATEYGRTGRAFLAQGLLIDHVNSEGMETFLPDSNGGSIRPLAGLARSALALKQISIMQDIRFRVQQMDGLEPIVRSELLYLAAELDYANMRLDDAEVSFQEILTLDDASIYAAKSSLRLAHISDQRHDYLTSAVYYLETAEAFSLYPEVSAEGYAGLNALIDGEMIDTDDLADALSKKRDQVAEVTGDVEGRK